MSDGSRVVTGGAFLRPILVRMLEGRVGSSLLMQLLATAPEIAFERIYPFENSYLTYSARLTGVISGPRPADRQVGDFLGSDPNQAGPPPFPATDLDCAAVARDSLRGVWQAFSAGLSTGSPDASLYAEKFWGDVAPVIAAGLNPIVVDLVRDPRDIVASVRAFNAKTDSQRFGRALAASDRQHLRRLVIGMGLRFEEFRAELPIERITLRYEDLITDLPAVSGRLSELFGVALTPATVQGRRAEMAHHITSVSDSASVGRWQTDLEPADIAAIERALAQPMLRLGYATSTDV